MERSDLALCHGRAFALEIRRRLERYLNPPKPDLSKDVKKEIMIRNHKTRLLMGFSGFSYDHATATIGFR